MKWFTLLYMIDMHVQSSHAMLMSYDTGHLHSWPHWLKAPYTVIITTFTFQSFWMSLVVSKFCSISASEVLLVYYKLDQLKVWKRSGCMTSLLRYAMHSGFDCLSSCVLHVKFSSNHFDWFKDDRQRFLQKVSKKQFGTVYYNANACG